MLTVERTSNTSSLYILLPTHYGLRYFFRNCGCNMPVSIIVAQGCREYETIIEAVQPTYKSMEEHSESITGVWLNRSHIDMEVWKYSPDPFCELDWNTSKL